MECRTDCGACCLAPSINEPYFGMPEGKPAGVACSHLDMDTQRCAIWNTEHYPEVCKNFRPDREYCGHSREEALNILTILENHTQP